MHASGAMRVTSDWLLALSRLCLHSLARMGSQEGPCASQDSAGASLLDRQTWWYRVTNVGPVRHRAIDSSELRLTTDREGRQVGQHRSHIVAAVSSAWLIARAAASGSQGRIVSSLSPGRPRADVGLSAVWSDLSAVSTTDQVRGFS